MNPAGGDGLPPAPIPDLVMEALIGSGGAGSVYRARQRFLDRAVAVKLLHDDGSPFTADYRRRFEREARILASLSHPHIVACHQAGLDPTGRPYLIMELVEGPNLHDWIAQHGPLSPVQALTVVSDLAAGLGHALAKGIIHRDVKPGNVLLAPRDGAVPGDTFPWTAKIVDLGLARSAGGVGDLTVTLAGAVVGTPASMAPEQFENPDGVDHLADIYGLGCVLFHALTGKHPFDATTLAGIVEQKLHRPPPDLRRAMPDAAPVLQRLATDLLAIDRTQRPGDYSTVIARCADAARNLEHRRPSRWPIATAVGGLIVAGAAAIAWSMAGAQAADRDTRTAPSASSDAAVSVIPSTVPPAAVPQHWGTPIDLLTGTHQGLPGWTNVRAQHAAYDEGDGLVLASGWLERPIDGRPWRISASFLRPPGMRTDTACIGLRLADGTVAGLSMQDLGAQSLALVGRIGVDDRPVGTQPQPVLRPSRDRWQVDLTLLADRLLIDLDGVALDPMPLPPGPLWLAIGHLPAELGSRGSVVIAAVTGVEPEP